MILGGLALSGGLAQLTLTGALRLAPVALVMPMDYTSLIWASDPRRAGYSGSCRGRGSGSARRSLSPAGW